MIHTWTSQFEGYPTETDRGSVTNLAQRNIKEAFWERFSEDHYLDPLVGAECYHLPGKSTVVEIVDETPSTNLVEGAVQHYGGLYYDNGITMDGASAGDHAALINRDAADHPQYIERDDPAGFVEVTGPISFGTSDKLSGMQETYVGPDTKEAISRGQHLGVSDDGGSKHLDDSFKMGEGERLGYEKFNILDGTVSHDVNSAAYVEFAFADCCFLPMVTAGVAVHLGAVNTDSDDYVGRFSCEAVGAGGTLAFKYYYLGD